ncbi:hypothetical protein [Streptomyces sp. NPDC059786]|uniref:hypothetical protein n=1 Tax=Streptomyces sp. NPDC059786 TaxID=3346946 RepID=UPI00365F9E96
MTADRFAAEDARLAEQRANEDAYRADYDATGGPRFDPTQPFGTTPTKPAPAIHRPTVPLAWIDDRARSRTDQRSAWRSLKKLMEEEDSL